MRPTNRRDGKTGAETERESVFYTCFCDSTNRRVPSAAVSDAKTEVNQQFCRNQKQEKLPGIVFEQREINHTEDAQHQSANNQPVLLAMVPDGVEKYEEKYFCSTCRELLEPYAQCGFVLVDLKNPETPTIYPVEVGTEFEVRCYKVSVIEDAEGELDITVLGTIPTDE